MTDKELLEFAAKANWRQELADEEVDLKYSEADEGMLYLCAENQDHNGTDHWYRWNPLLEDHDALRLAVKLGLLVDCDDVLQEVEAVLVMRGHDDDYVRMSEKYGNDPYAATRRAIVRAAAEIGQSPQGNLT